MESYIQISKINDFLYCPLSLYLHIAYDELDKREYQETAQIAGKIVHENIEKGEYSSAKDFCRARMCIVKNTILPEKLIFTIKRKISD